MIQTNQLGGEMLLHFEGSTEGPGSAGALLRVMRNLTVKNLTEGMTVSGEHLYLLRDIEAHVLQAAKNLKRTLDTAQTLGRETLVDIDEVVRQEDSDEGTLRADDLIGNHYRLSRRNFILPGS